MNKALVEHAVRALAELNSARNVEERSSALSRNAGGSTADIPRLVSEALAACGSLDCAGCYDVSEGKRIHPPKCGDDFRAWRERWEARGTV